MATIIENEFTEYDLTEEEQAAGIALSSFQVMNIKNKLSFLVRDRLAIIFDPKNPERFAQDEAYFQGKKDILTLLLAESEELNLTKEQLS